METKKVTLPSGLEVTIKKALWGVLRAGQGAKDNFEQIEIKILGSVVEPKLTPEALNDYDPVDVLELNKLIDEFTDFDGMMKRMDPYLKTGNSS